MTVLYQEQLFREIIVDNFAGGGGASNGIFLATGRHVDIAINHDPAAIAMHKANHPETKHYCENVWDVDPRKAVAGRPVALMWLSPDCKHFSKAKGGKPVEKNIRGLAWIAVRWAATVRPRVIILENVEEFKTWGPLLKDGRPDPDQKGRTFNAFVNALKRQGYKVDCRELRACDYGAPTIRKRLFLVARCDGQPIVWPKPTHGDPDSEQVKTGKLEPWRTAAEIIDWSLPCPSIFDSAAEIKAKYGTKVVRPLAENTMKRIARGIQKFVVDNQEPFVINGSTPFITKFHNGSTGHQIDEPLHTITAGSYIKRPGGAPHAMGLVTPFLTQYHSYASDGVRGQTLDRPLLTQDASNRYGLVKAFLTTYYGTGIGSNLTDPLPTVVSRDRFGLVVAAGLNYKILDIGMRMLEPHELFAAQGFPTDYIIDRDHEGKKYPKYAQVARCGNAVPPPFAEHLVRANLPEICVEKAA